MKPVLPTIVLLLALACSSAAAGRGLRGLDVSQHTPTTNATVEPRGFVEDIGEYFETAVEASMDQVAGVFGGGVCIYGRNCGANCEHDSYDKSDPLDKACYKHDRCLRKAETEEDTCECDDRLIRAADKIARRDEDSDMVRTAATVRDGMIAVGKTVHGCYF